MTIPADAAESLANRASSSQPSGVSERPLRILLVEDHVDTAVILGRLLRKMGHQVTVTGTVAAALQAEAEQFHAGKIDDLVISDVGLPDGNGLDLMRRLSAQYRVPGISLSGFGLDSDIAQSKAAGFYRHLIKPISMSLLSQTIAELPFR
jgi:CheY-like chemotaxis protein